ncbi:hypothetical protein RRG08_052715 [Elysia crispata]|uniref:Uncharacterized protein n=1 Tax=Elysia crispata TaxID=231223 RepID=A0AAE1E9R4_9GAST|nr:hypothetical protein RRG08_052715 [Elysia crispata]
MDAIINSSLIQSLPNVILVSNELVTCSDPRPTSVLLCPVPHRLLHTPARPDPACSPAAARVLRLVRCVKFKGWNEYDMNRVNITELASNSLSLSHQQPPQINYCRDVPYKNKPIFHCSLYFIHFMFSTMPGRLYLKDIFRLSHCLFFIVHGGVLRVRRDLQGNNLTVIRASDFQGFSNLRILQLLDNQIHTVESGAFRGLRSMLRLAVSHCDVYGAPVKSPIDDESPGRKTALKDHSVACGGRAGL